MRVIRGSASPPGANGRRVVAVGTFDGVHLGHQALLARARAIAGDAEPRAELTVVTFEPSPGEFLRPDGRDRRLTLPDEKLELLAQQGVDLAVVLNFDAGLARRPCERFISDVYVGGLGAEWVVAGESHTFGAGGQGTVETLAQLGRQHGLRVERVPLTRVREQLVTSTAIRALLRAGDVAAAGEMLGRPYEVRGEVVTGKGRGRRLGFPTANLALPDRKVIPADGVYAAQACVDEVRSAAAVSIGGAPTYGQRARVIEGFLLDGVGNLIGKQVRLRFVARLRALQRFENETALIAQLERDVAGVREFLADEGSLALDRGGRSADSPPGASAVESV